MYISHLSKPNMSYIWIELYLYVQWNPSCEAIPFASEKWPLVRGRNQYKCLDLYCQVAFPEGMVSRQSGLSKRVSLYHELYSYDFVSLHYS